MATYFVAEDGNDEAIGSEVAPWATIQHAADTAITAGDIVYIRSGTYNEQVTKTAHSGADGSPIIFAKWWADPTRPICRGFILTGVSWLQFIDIEVGHVNTTYRLAFDIEACTHIDILRCYLHETFYEAGMIDWRDVGTEHIAVRDCEMYLGNSQYQEGFEQGNSAGVAGSGGHGHLIEYNHVHRCGDFLILHAGSSIIRNNYCHDYLDSYWPHLVPDALHADIFQPCNNGIFYATWCVWESNYGADNLELNSHAIIQQCERADDHHMLYRGNVFTRFGGGVAEIGGADQSAFICNTMHDFLKVGSGDDANLRHTDWDRSPVGHKNFNNLLSHTGGPIEMEAGLVSPVCEHNWGHASGSHDSYEGTDDPLFVNDLSDWHLQSGSPAIDQGRAISTVATADGSGTEFDVAAGDGWLFCDGYGIAEGDLIAVGTGDPVRITDVTGDTVTVASSISWTQGDGVYWRSKQALDIGAYEYRAGGYAYDVTLGVASNGVITATPTVPALVRDVEFWIDGLPVERLYDGPYTYAWNLAGLSGQHFIEVRAHALYADPDLWQSADRTVTVTDGAVVEGEGDLYEVTYDANGAVSGSVPTDATDYAETDPVTVLGNTGALARPYYSFEGWNTQADGEGTTYREDDTFDMPAANVTLYAIWRAKCVALRA